MPECKTARQITLSREFSELEHLLCKLNDTVRWAESIEARGVSADVDLMSVTEALRGARATVRHAIDLTGQLVDEVAEGGD